MGNFWPQAGTTAKVVSGRFEIERDGKVAYLEYTIAGQVLGLVHTEVPDQLRGLGLAASLAGNRPSVCAPEQIERRRDLPFGIRLHLETSGVFTPGLH